MKDDCAVVPISEFVGMRSKMHSIIRSDELELHKAKGVKKNVLKQEHLSLAVEGCTIRAKDIQVGDGDAA